MVKILLILFLSLLTPAWVSVADIWCNPANTGAETGLSESAGYNSLHEAMATMSAGDTVIISDGDWRNTAGMYIVAGYKPPSGSVGVYSTVRAANDWGVKIPYISIETLSSVTQGYLVFRGIVFDNQYIGTGTGHVSYHMHHTKFIRCGFLAHGLTENNHACGFGNSDPDRSLNQYNLMEECVVWGSGRYMIYSKDGQYNVFRRCVVRHDYHDGLGGQDDGQIFNFRAYACDYHIYQNCISIDSDRVENFSSVQSEAGGYWLGDSYGATGNKADGSISIKDVHLPYYVCGSTGQGTSYVNNSVALDCTVAGATTLSAMILKSDTNVVVSNCLGYGATESGQDGFYGKNDGDLQ